MASLSEIRVKPSVRVSQMNQANFDNPSVGILSDTPAVVTCREFDPRCGIERAMWLPSDVLVRQPMRLRHAPSTAVLLTSSGHVWVVSLMDYAWSQELVIKIEEFLSPRHETWSWERLEVGLSEHLELPLVLHRANLLDNTSLLSIDALSDAILRRWMTLQTQLPDPKTLRKMKSDVSKHIEMEAGAALEELLIDIDPEIKALLTPMGLPLHVYNYVASRTHRRARSQFVSDFPVLIDAVCAPEDKTVWAALRGVIDREASPIRFLSTSLGVSLSAIRSLRGVNSVDVGPHFQKHPKELIELLDSLPPQHRPKTSDAWRVFQDQYSFAKAFFGRSPSPAAAVLIKARLGHSMRLIVGLNRPAAPISEEDVREVERLRAGMQRSLFSHFQVEQTKLTLNFRHKGKIARNIDQFMGHVSWRRLLELSRKFEKCRVEAIEKNQDAIRFIASQKYYDFLCVGAFTAANGWTARCLLSASELTGNGTKLDLCLATATHRNAYHVDCFLSKITIIAFQNNGRVTSTAEFRVVVVGKTLSSSNVDFQLRQHRGQGNQPPAKDDVEAMAALQRQFSKPEWQAHALVGVRMGIQRAHSDPNNEMTGPMLVASMEGFRATFGLRSDELLQQFLEGVD